MRVKCKLDLETPKTNQVKVDAGSLSKNSIDKMI